MFEGRNCFPHSRALWRKKNNFQERSTNTFDWFAVVKEKTEEWLLKKKEKEEGEEKKPMVGVVWYIYAYVYM